MITLLNTPRSTLRRFRPDDAGDLHEYLSDPRVYRFEPGDPLNREQASKRAAEMAASPHFWAVVLRSTGKVIGQVYLEQIEPLEHLTCELGYILSPAYQCQGYGAEAAAALVHHALTDGAMHRIVAHCNPENIASWKLLKKIGFRREGLHRQDIFFRRDAAGAPLWTDTYVYALLAAEVSRLPMTTLMMNDLCLGSGCESLSKIVRGDGCAVLGRGPDPSRSVSGPANGLCWTYFGC